MPRQPTPEFRALASEYNQHPIEFSNLKNITLAQWLLESGWGSSELARRYKNFGGLKWRPNMDRFARKVLYTAHDGEDYYCEFASYGNFIDGYWAFLDRPPYRGWRDTTASSEDFIHFIGGIYAEDTNYAEKVLDLLPFAEEISNAGAGVDLRNVQEHSDETQKPHVDRFVPTSHYYSRNGSMIDLIVIHYTDGRSTQSAIQTFLDETPGKRVSAHYIVGRDGELVQMVDDSEAAWHSGKVDINQRSIGIEHVAMPGEMITEQQEVTSIALVKWLLSTYKIKGENVIPHDRVHSTDCPGHLLGAYGPDSDHYQAVQKWLAEKLQRSGRIEV